MSPKTSSDAVVDPLDSELEILLVLIPWDMMFLIPSCDVTVFSSRDWPAKSDATALVVFTNCKLTCGVRPLRQLSTLVLAGKVPLNFAPCKDKRTEAPWLLKAPSPLPVLWIAALAPGDEDEDDE